MVDYTGKGGLLDKDLRRNFTKNKNEMDSILAIDYLKS